MRTIRHQLTNAKKACTPLFRKNKNLYQLFEETSNLPFECKLSTVCCDRIQRKRFLTSINLNMRSYNIDFAIIAME